MAIENTVRAIPQTPFQTSDVKPEVPCTEGAKCGYTVSLLRGMKYHEDGKPCGAGYFPDSPLFVSDEQTCFGNRNPWQFVCYFVARKFANAEFAPEYLRNAEHCEELEAEVAKTLYECFVTGVEPEKMVSKCFKALDTLTLGAVQTQAERLAKLPKSEALDEVQRALVVSLYTLDPESVGLDDETATSALLMLDEDTRKGYTRLAELFHSVKEAHGFAKFDKWLCAQCYALGVPTDDAVAMIYGVAVSDETPKKLHNARVKYSANASEVSGWLLDEVKKNPDGLGKWEAVLRRTENAAKAKKMLDEVEKSVDPEVLKFMRSITSSLPERVIAFCESKGAK